jgi:arylsulfatase A-like enzyme
MTHQTKLTRFVRPLTFIFQIISLTGLTLSAGMGQRTAARPNIIFIMADDMGYSDLGCYGGEIDTPNLDQLAKGGIKLRNFYNNARCCPTRASLLTGQYPHTVGMGFMVSQIPAPIKPGSYQGFLDDRYPTIAERMKEAGYTTYMAGKWHVGERPEHWPRKRGFEHYFGLVNGASGYYGIVPADQGKRHIVLDDDIFTPSDSGFYMTDAFTDYALGYLDQQQKERANKPFFLYLAYTAPHFPLHAYEEDIAKYADLYRQGWDVTRANRFKKMKALGLVDQRYLLNPRPDDIPSWETAEDKETWVRKMSVYAAMVDRMDRNIGRLIARLRVNKQLDNTLIVFLSDNGGCAETLNRKNYNDPAARIGAPGSYTTYNEPWANVSNTPFKKYKHFMHEGGICTPLIMHWPAKIRATSGYSDATGHVIDLLPTALELAGAQSKNLAGRSLSYLWNGTQAPSRTLCWEHEGNRAVRQGKWKLVKDKEDPAWELYDLQSDPVETRDLAAQNTTRVKAMILEYDRWAKEVGAVEK